MTQRADAIELGMASDRRRGVTWTEDGTVIIVDPELGQAVSGRTVSDAEAEVRRRKAMAGKEAA